MLVASAVCLSIMLSNESVELLELFTVKKNTFHGELYFSIFKVNYMKYSCSVNRFQCSAFVTKHSIQKQMSFILIIIIIYLVAADNIISFFY